MISPTSFSLVAKKLRYSLAQNIVGVEEGSISISQPNNVNTPADGTQAINLFFYRIERDDYPSDGTNENPFFVRMNCLITAFGTGETIPLPGGEETSLTISAGENDLRIIGEVMRVMHEEPILIVFNESESMQLQCVMMSLSVDDLNHIWSTQADTPYRLSIAYELALVPVPFKKVSQKSPLATSVGMIIKPDMQPPVLPATGFAVHTDTPSVNKSVINVSDQEWSPQIAFLSEGKLSYVKNIADTETTLTFDVLFSGEKGTEIYFYWELWQWNLATNTGGWASPLADALSAEIIIPAINDPVNPLLANVIDPELIDTRLKCTVQLPVVLPPEDNIRIQASLYVIRTRQRQVAFDDPIEYNIRSNPLAVTIYHEVSE